MGELENCVCIMDDNIEKKVEAPDSAAGQTREEVTLSKYGFKLFPNLSKEMGLIH